MDRVFLDANVLFSAAYADGSGLLRLWRLPGAQMITSAYAAAEARSNLPDPAQQDRLARLLRETHIWAEAPADLALPQELALAEKDAPILLAAVYAGCTHILTGDLRHFGPFFGQAVRGVLILRPAVYLRSFPPMP